MIILSTADASFDAAFTELLGRGKMDMEHVSTIVNGIISEIRTEKNTALKRHISKFDNWTPASDEDLKMNTDDMKTA